MKIKSDYLSSIFEYLMRIVRNLRIFSRNSSWHYHYFQFIIVTTPTPTLTETTTAPIIPGITVYLSDFT